MLAEQTFMVANHCNLSCTYCWYETGSADYVKKVLDSAAYDSWLRRCTSIAPVRSVRFTGGEPLLRDDFPDLLSAAARHAEHTAVFTNGVLVTRDMATRLADTGTEVHLSLDHLSPGIEDRVRGGTKATLRGLDTLQAAGVRTMQLCMVLTSRNWTDLPAVIERARKDGLGLELMAVALPDVHPLSLRTLAPAGRERLAERIAAEHDLLGRPAYYQRLRRYLVSGQLRATPGCATARTGVFVDSDGEIRLCPQRSGVSLGNITDADPVTVLTAKDAESQARRPGSCVSLDCLVLT